MARHTRLCAVAGLAIVALSGCGARTTAAGDTPPRLTVTSTTSASSAPAPTSPNPLTGESPPPSAENGCTADMLVGSVKPENAEAGARRVTLVVRNKTQQECTLQGYGGLELLDIAKEVLPTRAERTLAPEPALVTLRPGAEAGKVLQWGVVAAAGEPEQGPCQPVASSINVTPPDETTPFEVDFEFGSVCEQGLIETSAYFARAE